MGRVVSSQGLFAGEQQKASLLSSLADDASCQTAAPLLSDRVFPLNRLLAPAGRNEERDASAEQSW